MNPGKIRRMARIEKFVDKEAADHLKTARYYRSDYLGLLLIRNFFLVTIGYILIITLYLLRNGEDLLNQIYTIHVAQLAYSWVIAYVVLLIAYSVLCYLIGSFRHSKARKMERYVDSQLEKLQEKYTEEQ